MIVIGQFVATDPRGGSRLVLALSSAKLPRHRPPIMIGGRVVAGGRDDREFRAWPERRKSLTADALQADTGESLTRVEKGKYRIDATGEILTSADPAAP